MRLSTMLCAARRAAIFVLVMWIAHALQAQSLRGTFEKHVFNTDNDVTFTAASVSIPVDYTYFDTHYTGSISVTFPATIENAAIDGAQRYLTPGTAFAIHVAPSLGVAKSGTNDITVNTSSTSVQQGDTAPDCSKEEKRTKVSGNQVFTPTIDCSFTKLALTDRGTAWAATIKTLITISAFTSSSSTNVRPDSTSFVTLTITSTYLVAKSQMNIVPSVASNIEGITDDPLAVTISGTGFQANAQVAITDLSVTNVVVVSDTQINAKVTGFRGLLEGQRDLTVTNTNGSKQTSPGLFFVSSLGPSLEVNQGVPMTCSSDRPCVADHDTWVRVKIPCSGNGCESGKTAVRGRLHVKKDGSPISGSPFSPQPVSMRVRTAGTAFDSATLHSGGDALNFRLTGDAALGEGTYDFTFEIDPRAPSTAPAGVEDRDRRLVRDLKLQPFKRSRFDRAIHLAYMIDQAPAARRLRPIDTSNVEDFTRAAFPVSKDLITVGLSMYEDTFSGDNDPVIDTLRRLHHVAMFEQIHNEPATTYALMITENTGMSPGASACSEGSSGFISCWGLSSIIRWEGPDSHASLAHEIGHHFFLGDTYTNEPPGGEDRSRLNPSCQSIHGCPVETGHVDTLSGDLSVVLSTASSFTKLDVMGNNPLQQRWIDKRTWDYLYPLFMLTGTGKGLPDAAPSQRWLVVRGRIRPDDSVTLDPFDSYDGHDALTSLASGEYSVEVRDAGGSVVASRTFPISFKVPHRTTTAAAFPFEVPVVFPTTAKRVVVKHGTTELASRTISSNAPLVKVLAPNGGETIGASTTIRWSGSDADGDVLTYAVLYSPDGVQWTTLATDLATTSYDWKTELARGSTSARIMITASDGVLSSSDTSDAPFTIAPKPPLVAFESPIDGYAAAAGQAITFTGLGYDTEDGELPGSALSYASNLQGSLGTGRSITVSNLSTGTHRVTVTARDKSGNTSTATITVTVYIPAADLRVLPVIGSAPGSLGSFFKSAMQLHNPTTGTQSGRIVYHAAGASGSAADPGSTYVLGSGQTIYYADYLPVIGLGGLGSADIFADYGGAPLSVTRIFNDAGAGGTSGLTEDLFKRSDALQSGSRGVLIAPPDPSKARFNIGVRTLESSVSMTINVTDRNGVSRTTLTKSYGPNFFEQRTSSDFLGLTVAGSDVITIRLDAGSAIVYGSTTDNITQDPSLQIARALPAAPSSGSETRVIPVVGSVAGSFGSFFRTAIQFYNPWPVTIAANLNYCPTGTAPCTATGFNIAPGTVRVFSDFLPEIGLSGLGSVDAAFTGGYPVAVVRIFNDAGSKGTSGMTEEPVRTAEAIGPGESGVLIAPPEPSKARFNIGVRIIGTNASMLITVRDKDGVQRTAVPKAYNTVPNFFEQVSANALVGLTLRDNDTITFTMNSGTVIIYGSTTDNVSQDPSLQYARKVGGL